MPYPSVFKNSVPAILLTASIACGDFSPLLADPTPPASTPETPVQLSPFVVGSNSDVGYTSIEAQSATGLNAPVKQIPLTIDIVNSELMNDLAAQNLTEALSYTAAVSPSFDITNPYLEGYLALRGFLTETPLLDGVDQNFATIDLTNIDRIEIVEGPSAVLYGVSIPGGILNFITMRPQGTPQAEFTLTTGSWGLFKGQINATGPVKKLAGGELKYRVDLSASDQRNYLANTRDSQDRFYSPQLEWDSSHGTSIRYIYEHFDHVYAYPGGVPLYLPSAVAAFDALPAAQQTAAAANAAVTATGSNRWAIATYLPLNVNPEFAGAYVDSEHDSNELVIEQQLGEHWTAHTDFTYYDIRSNSDGGSAQMLNADGISADLATSAYRQRSDDDVMGHVEATGKYHWGFVDFLTLVGLEYYRDRYAQNTYGRDLRTFSSPYLFNYEPAPYDEYFPASNTALQTSQLEPFTFLESYAYARAVERAGFATGRLSFWQDRVMLYGGGRRDRYDNTRPNQFSQSQTSTNGVVTAKQTNTSIAGYRDYATSPFVGLNFTPIEAVTLYTSYSETFQPESGTKETVVNGDIVSSSSYVPETGRGSEAGVKVDFWKEKLTGSYSVYHLENANIPYVITVNSENYTDTQIDQATVNGQEVSLSFRPVPGWQTIASMAKSDASYSDLTLATEGAGGAVRAPGVPHNQWSLWTHYTFLDGLAKGWSIGAGARFIGTTVNSATADLAFNLPGYTLYDAELAYVFQIGRTLDSVQFNAQNLTNVEYFVRGPALGMPRQLILSYKIKI